MYGLRISPHQWGLWRESRLYVFREPRPTILHSKGWNDTDVLLKNAQGMHQAAAGALCVLLEAQGFQSRVQALLGHTGGQKS